MRDMYEDAGEFTTNMLNKFWILIMKIQKITMMF